MSPKALLETEIDPIAEQVDNEMQASGEDTVIPQHKADPNAQYGDLSDGGQIGSARLITQGESGHVIFDKNKREPGRATVRKVWLWNGTPSTIPLTWDSDGKTHDGGRRHLVKRHCTVCNFSGFKGQICPQCRKDGRRLAPPVPAYYLKESQVPVHQVFFGKEDCFVPSCVRRGEYAFLSDMQMREHAMSRHQKEYKAFQDAAQANNGKELADMRAIINTFLLEKAGLKPEASSGHAQEEPEVYRSEKVTAKKK